MALAAHSQPLLPYLTEARHMFPTRPPFGLCLFAIALCLVITTASANADGVAYNLAVGSLRGRYREFELSPELLTPGEVYPITVDLGPIAAQLAPGHSLRVDLCGAYFPLFDRNPNTVEGIFGKTSVPSNESVYHTFRTPSRIILPVKTGSSTAATKEQP